MPLLIGYSLTCSQLFQIVVNNCKWIKWFLTKQYLKSSVKKVPWANNDFAILVAINWRSHAQFQNMMEFAWFFNLQSFRFKFNTCGVVPDCEGTAAYIAPNCPNDGEKNCWKLFGVVKLMTPFDAEPLFEPKKKRAKCVAAKGPPCEHIKFKCQLTDINLWVLSIIFAVRCCGRCWNGRTTFCNFRFGGDIVLYGLTINVIGCNTTLSSNKSTVTRLLFWCTYYRKYWCAEYNLFLYLEETNAKSLKIKVKHMQFMGRIFVLMGSAFILNGIKLIMAETFNRKASKFKFIPEDLIAIA